MSTRSTQIDQMRNGHGFIAALDQSGGSTPKALKLYGIGDRQYSSDTEMFDLIHCMRTRIISSPSFSGDRILGAILFEMTMNRDVDGIPTAEYLWKKRRIVPFLKVDSGLSKQENGTQCMKPMPKLRELLGQAGEQGIFGTKMRSVIHAANQEGITANLVQQFDIALEILSVGLVPIVEPEISISIPDKADAEDLLLAEILSQIKRVPKGQQIMLKLTLPESANLYRPLVDHPQIMRVVALSGGYSRTEANLRLAQNAGVVASFSRALTEGLSVRQSDEEFNRTLSESVDSIYAASLAG